MEALYLDVASCFLKLSPSVHDKSCFICRFEYNPRVCNAFIYVRRGTWLAPDKRMRLYYRLLILNLAILVPLTWGAWLHNLRKPALLILSIALSVVNYAIGRKIARQSEASSLKKIKWEFDVWWAWTSGPVITGWLPLMFASLLVRTDFEGIIELGLMAYFAFSSWATVNKSEQRRVNNWANSS